MLLLIAAFAAHQSVDTWCANGVSPQQQCQLALQSVSLRSS